MSNYWWNAFKINKNSFYFVEALNRCYGDGCKFNDEDILFMPNVCIIRRIQKDGLCKENLNVTCIFGWYHEIGLILNENIKLIGVKEKKNRTKHIIQAGIDQIQLIQSALLTVTSTFFTIFLH